MDRVRQTTIRFSPEMYGRLEQAGIRTGLPLNSIVTVACIEWLERHLPDRLEDSAPVRSGGLLEKLRPGKRGRTGRLAPGAQNVLSLAQDEARRLNHSYLGTEHLLLGLVIDQDSLAGQVLAELGVDPQRVRQQVEAMVGRDTCSTNGGARLTPRSKNVLELAAREAKRRRDAAVAPEHLLLGLVQEGEGVAVSVLERLGTGPEAVQAAVERRV